MNRFARVLVPVACVLLSSQMTLAQSVLKEGVQELSGAIVTGGPTGLELLVGVETGSQHEVVISGANAELQVELSRVAAEEVEEESAPTAPRFTLHGDLKLKNEMYLFTVDRIVSTPVEAAAPPAGEQTARINTMTEEQIDAITENDKFGEWLFAEKEKQPFRDPSDLVKRLQELAAQDDPNPGGPWWSHIGSSFLEDWRGLADARKQQLFAPVPRPSSRAAGPSRDKAAPAASERGRSARVSHKPAP